MSYPIANSKISKKFVLTDEMWTAMGLAEVIHDLNMHTVLLRNLNPHASQSCGKSRELLINCKT